MDAQKWDGVNYMMDLRLNGRIALNRLKQAVEMVNKLRYVRKARTGEAVGYRHVLQATWKPVTSSVIRRFEQLTLI